MNNKYINFDLERKLRRYAISDLIKYVVYGQGILFALMMIMPTLGYRLYSLMTLTRSGLFAGQIWRLVTFIFVPPSSSPLFITSKAPPLGACSGWANRYFAQNISMARLAVSSPTPGQ